MPWRLVHAAMFVCVPGTGRQAGDAEEPDIVRDRSRRTQVADRERNHRRVSTFMYFYVLLCTFMHFYVLLCIFMHVYVLFHLLNFYMLRLRSVLSRVYLDIFTMLNSAFWWT